MTQSGITVKDEVITTYTNHLQLSNKEPKYKYMILTIIGDQIDIESVGTLEDVEKVELEGSNADELQTMHKKFVKLLEGKGPCYLVYDFKFMSARSEDTKIVLITWIPEGTTVKPKMKYSTTANTLKSKLQGHHKYIEAFDYDDISYETLKEKAQSAYK